MRKPVSRTPGWVVPVAVVAAIALLVAAFLIIRWYTTPLAPPPLAADPTARVVSSITSLPASEFDTVGMGTAQNTIKPVSGPLLTGPNGHPELFYFGAEFCPYCAAERWPIIIALSRFGTFSGLRTTSSSSTDAYPNTPTFTFHGSTYQSQYLDFVAVETSDRNGRPLQSPTPAQQALVSQYDTSGSIPFVDFGNRYALSGSTYVPDVLAGMSWQAVADALRRPDSPQAKSIVGSANLITAAVCKLTSDQPAPVCSSPAIQAIEKTLG
jgi:thiol-disulfide isomerase/thioredoxin